MIDTLIKKNPVELQAAFCDIYIRDNSAFKVAFSISRTYKVSLRLQ